MRTDPKADTLDAAGRLADKARTVLQQRDDAIRYARAEGASLGEIADATGLSRAGVSKICSR